MTIRFGSAPRRSPSRLRRSNRRRSPAKRSRARATIASSAGSRVTAGGPPASAAGTELLRRVAEGPDLRGGLLASLELLAVSVDPDHGHVHLQQGPEVGLVAGGNAPPPLLPADPPRRLVEVRGVGLVAADLLRGDDELELGPQMAARDAEQLVVDVR